MEIANSMLDVSFSYLINYVTHKTQNTFGDPALIKIISSTVKVKLVTLVTGKTV